MLFGMFLWGISYALSWVFVPVELQIICLKITYLGAVTIPGFFLIFTLRITGRDSWLTFNNIVLLFAEPTIMTIILWFAPRFAFTSIESVMKEGYHLMSAGHGLWFWSNTIYSYGIVIFSLLLLMASYRNANALFKRQYIYILLGAIIPLCFSLFTQTNKYLIGDLDLTPVSFGISGIVYAYAIFRHQFMNLVPIARSSLIENMSDGVLVLDAQGRIVDMNPAMENFLDAEPKSFIGKKASDALTIWNEGTKHLLTGQETRTEMRLPNRTSRYLDLRVTPLYDEYQSLNGRLIVFRDITDRKEVEKDLRHALDRMQSQLIEIGVLQSQLRDQAIRDALTNLFNRRYLDETLEREVARATREVYPLCIVMMDIDHFKNVNDTYSHEAGDLVLRDSGKNNYRPKQAG